MPNTTLAGASACFRLTNSCISNAQIAEALGLNNVDKDAEGLPACCFYIGALIVAIRLNEQHVVIFSLYKEVQRRMSELGTRVDIE